MKFPPFGGWEMHADLGFPLWLTSNYSTTNCALKLIQIGHLLYSLDAKLKLTCSVF